VRTLALAALALVLATTAFAATALDPSALVIRASDVPVGYRLERSESGLRTNALEAKETPEATRLFRRWGRVTGYQMIFERGESSIEARSDVFRSATGARELQRWAEREVRLSGIRGIRRANPGIGAQSLLVEMRAPRAEVYVYWRYGVVWSALGGHNLGRAQVLALARLQQRRIAATLG
jgi:hypothetical protein